MLWRKFEREYSFYIEIKKVEKWLEKWVEKGTLTY